MRLGTRKLTISGMFATAGALALLLAGCGGTSSTAGVADKASDQTLKLTWATGGGADIPTADPGESYDSASEPIVNLIYDPLVTLDKDLNVKAWAAKSWTTQDNGATYVFTLQPNQKFSDGTPLKASDYAWSYDREFNPCGGFFNDGTATLMVDVVNNSGIVGSHAFSQEKCANGKPQGAVTTLVGTSIIPDDAANTLTIKLSAPSAYFLDSMTLPFSMAVERKLVENRPDLGYDGTWLDQLMQGSTGQGGSGMFYVSQWDHKSKLYLKANPNWWGIAQGMKPNFTDVQFNLFESIDTLYQTYQSDQTYAYDDAMPAASVAAAKSLPDFKQAPLASTEAVGLNWKIAPFNDINARKAFCLALNRDALNTSVLKGNSVPSWNLYPPGLPGYDKNIQGPEGAPTTGDLAKAQADWAAYKATLNGKPVPAITLSFNVSSSTQKLLAEAYQSTWQKAFPDANITISTNPWKQQVKTLFSGTMQLGRDGWLADYADPQDFLSVLYHTGVGNNYFNSTVPTADTLLDQADKMTDLSQQAQRFSLYNQAEQQLVDNVAVCPMFTGQQHYAIRTWVKGGWERAANEQVPLFAWATGYIAKH